MGLRQAWVFRSSRRVARAYSRQTATEVSTVRLARDAAGPIWYAALRDNRLQPTATFQDFARLTVANAQQSYGQESAEADAVTAAWDTVKVPL